jgi:hypothetical protein
MKTKKLKFNLNDIKDIQPANRKWCLCVIEDYDTKEQLIRTGYYEGGTLWETDGCKASGCGNIIFWTYINEWEIK